MQRKRSRQEISTWPVDQDGDIRFMLQDCEAR